MIYLLFRFVKGQGGDGCPEDFDPGGTGCVRKDPIRTGKSAGPPLPAQTPLQFHNFREISTLTWVDFSVGKKSERPPLDKRVGVPWPQPVQKHHTVAKTDGPADL